MRFTLGILCLTVLSMAPAMGAGSDDWPTPPKRTTLETPYGTLAVHPSDYLYGATLTFNQTPTTPRLQGILNIPYAYVVGREEMALVSEDKGLASCPVSYYWVVLSARGLRITAPFGSCSANIRVTAHGSRLQMETPNPKDPTRLDRWQFDGQKVRKAAVRR